MSYNENLAISGLYNSKNDNENNELRDYSIYNYQYYSGGDVSIYFGDTWVDEIIGIQFQMQEKVSPLYGYADYVYSHLARGNRAVYGKFRINFTEAGYLSGILNRLKSNPLGTLPDNIKREDNIITKQTVNEQSFDQYADYYEATMWGEKDKDTVSIARTDNAPRLSKQTFDIVIGYGATPANPSTGIVQMKDYNKASSTMQIIKNVTLTGKSQIIDTSDNVLLEEYDFIAQDIL